MNDRHSRRRHALAVAAVAVSSFLATSCHTAEPHRDINPDRVQPISIGVSQDSMEQKVMAEIYAQALLANDRSAAINVFSRASDTEQIDELIGGSSDLVIGCTGDLLTQGDPRAAAQLEGEVDASSGNPNDTQINAEVYEALMASLPGSVTASDQSGAQGCSHSSADLPQNIVPVFTKMVFNSEERGLISLYTKLVTTEDLQELVEQSRRGSVSEVVADWMGDIPAKPSSDKGSEQGFGPETQG